MAAYDDLIAKDNVHISNQSNGTPYNAGNADDPTCTGTTNFGRTINEVYEAGILPVIAAGNSGQVGSTCTLSSPSAALGAFTVAGHGSNRNTDTETAVRSGSLSSTSSQGPASLRTMVDLSAYEGRTLLPDVSGGYAYNNVGTSFAAPTVVAAALNFIHFYKSTFSDFIENPGALAANMLLMGDRQGASGLQTQRFSNQWGAGRMKMRLWNTEGIDNPAIYATGSVCVGHNQVVTIPLNSGNAFSSDIDYIKAVAYWHDTRHDMSAKAPVDTITMIATMLPALWA
ncbi:MAG: S8 family serine peptidase [bacterium]